MLVNTFQNTISASGHLLDKVPVIHFNSLEQLSEGYHFQQFDFSARENFGNPVGYTITFHGTIFRACLHCLCWIRSVYGSHLMPYCGAIGSTWLTLFTVRSAQACTCRARCQWDTSTVWGNFQRMRALLSTGTSHGALCFVF